VPRYRWACLSVSLHFWPKCILSEVIKECMKKDGSDWSSLTHLHPTRGVVMRTLPRAHSKAARPSSHAMRAPSLLSSFLGWARSCCCNSTTIIDATTTFEGDGALPQSASRDRRHDKEASPGKRQHGVKTHLTDGNARLAETSSGNRDEGSCHKDVCRDLPH
jgi:hypothetical protein